MDAEQIDAATIKAANTRMNADSPLISESMLRLRVVDLADLVDQLAAALRQARNAADDDYDNFAKAEQIKKARAMAGRMREMADHPNEPWAENAIRTGSYYEGLRLEAATIDQLCDALEQAQAERDSETRWAKDYHDKWAAAEAENTRLRSELQFYADMTSWHIDDVGEWAFSRDELIDVLPWEPASAALNPEAGRSE